MKKLNLFGSQVFVNDSPNYSNFWASVDDGSWEKHTLSIIDRILARDSVYIDIGAWIGPTVLKAAQTAKKVVAYEPDPVAREELRTNVELNGLGNVEIRDFALFDEEGVMKFGGGYANELGKSVSSLMYGDRGIDVTVKDVAREVGAPEFTECSLLKIDVEGAEYRLIRRMSPYLNKVRPSLLLSTHSRKITGRPGFKGMMAQMSDLIDLVKILNSYNHIYIETRTGWAGFSLLQRLKFIVSVNSNRQILALNVPIQSLG